MKAMGMGGISKSQVSRLCEEIDGKIKTFLTRPFEGDWPYLWLDATYLKVRRDGRIVSVAAIIAVGVNCDGRREVLGLEIGASEAETFWTEFLRKLTRRGLRGVKLVIFDAPRRPEGRRGRLALHRPRQAGKERLHRELQWAPARRLPERDAVHLSRADAAASLGGGRAGTGKGVRVPKARLRPQRRSQRRPRGAG